MENEKSITEAIEKRDWKLKFQAMFLWWKLCFIFIFLIVFILSIFFDETNSFLKILKSAVIAFIGAFPADVLSYFIILPLLTRKRKVDKLIKKVFCEGITAENLIKLERAFVLCEGNELYSTYVDEICIFLTDYYIKIGEYQKAEENLVCINLPFYLEHKNAPSVQLFISNYYQLRLYLDSQKNGREAANAAYALSEPYFSKFYGENEFINYLIDSGTAEYDCANGRYNDAIQRILSYVEFKEVKCETYASLARYSAAAGNMEQAMQYLQLAEKYIRNATDKAQMEYLRSTILC